MPRWMAPLRFTLRSVFRRNRAEQELDEEFQDHLQREIDQALRAGLSPREARFAALRAMGPIARSREEARDARGVNWIDDLVRDLQYARRSFRRSPGFVLLALLIMAFGIGANTAVFSVVNAVLLKPLAYRDPDRIVRLTSPDIAAAAGAFAVKQISIPNFQDWHDQSSSFDAMAYYGSREAPVVAGATAEYAQVTSAGPEFLSVFAISPLIGRNFTPEELQAGGNGAAILSYSFWKSHFGGDPGALGQNIRVYSRTLSIVGVLPPGFGFPDKTDVWFPARVSADDRKYRGAQNWLAIGRLKAGVSIESAQIEMGAIARRLAQAYPDTNKNTTAAVTRLRDDIVGDIRLTLYLLLGAVSIVLLIACANTATLLLGKAAVRTREIAVRTALGASRRRIVRQLITESLLLAFLAGAAGLLLAYLGSKALVALAPAGLPRLTEVGVDRWVLIFTVGVSAFTSLLFGLIPALHASKLDLNEALKQSASKSVLGGRTVRLRGLLVAGEIALAVMLLSGAGLLMKSFITLQKVALGFRPENVLLMRATVPVRMQDQAATQFFEELLPKIKSVPGVVSAGATMAPPGNIESSSAVFVDRLPPEKDWLSAPTAALSVVAPGTFAALGIPLKGGRDFNDRDTLDRPLIAVVNESLAHAVMPGRNPIGRNVFCLFDSLKPMTIVGVVGDVRQSGPAQAPVPECYMPYRQHGFNGNTLSVVAHTSGDPVALEQTFRRIAHDTAPDVPVRFTTMEARLSENVAAPRFRTLLFGLFAALAVSLAVAGIYGVMAYAVGQRTSEIGLRMALGASSGSVLRMILGEGLTLAVAGLTLGLIGAAAGTRLLAAMLFEVKPSDPWVYVTVALLLLAVALAAAYLPARRAARIDPIAALREQ